MTRAHASSAPAVTRRHCLRHGAALTAAAAPLIVPGREVVVGDDEADAWFSPNPLRAPWGV